MEQSLSQSATPGNIRAVPTYCFINGKWDSNKNKYIYSFSTNNYYINSLREEDTYITILNVKNNFDSYAQSGILECMESSPHIKIIYKSPLAVNRRPGHGTEPRNMFIVWEWINNPKVGDVKSNTL